MAGPADILDRLLSALEDLVAGERIALRAGDYAGAVALQERAEPVVARLVELAPTASAASRARAQAVVARREEHSRLVGDAIEQTRGELSRMAEGRRVAARIAPVYGRPRTAGASQFSGQA